MCRKIPLSKAIAHIMWKYFISRKIASWRQAAPSTQNKIFFSAPISSTFRYIKYHSVVEFGDMRLNVV